jgi:hypothetical protein
MSAPSRPETPTDHEARATAPIDLASKVESAQADVGKVAWLAIALVLAVAVLFRVWGLGHLPGVNGDEAYYGVLMLEWKAGANPALVTFSGLPINPFYSGVLLLIHLVWPTPSFVILRLPALLSGLLAVGLAYPLLGRVFDRRTALVTVLLLACLPIAIAYSRFGWDQSQAPLVGLICIYFALKRRVLATISALIVAVIVHPLNLGLLPIILGPAALAWLARQERRRLLTVGIGLVVLGLGTVYALTLLSGTVQGSSPAKSMTQWASPAAWGQFAAAYGELLSGTTIYQYIPGQMPTESILLERIVFWGLALGLLAAGLPRLLRRRDYVVLGLLGGLAVSLAGMFLIVGIVPLTPGFERYGMYLVTPSCLVFALLLRDLGSTPLAWRCQLGGVLVLCGVLLGSFYQRYFVVLHTTGGQAARAFWTGPVEPKEAALASIMATVKDEPVTILTEDHWTYFPIRYLAWGRPGVRVLLSKQLADNPAELTETRRRFLVGFAGGPSEEWLAKNAPSLPRQAFFDYACRPVLYVWDLGTNPELSLDLGKLPEQPPASNLRPSPAP